jgi:general secretion pathway protein A
MYYRYFGLQEEPFSIAVNPRYLFMSARHRDALAHLLYGVGAGGGFILLTGEVGTGKTTINRCLLEQLPAETDIAIILNPALNAVELLATVCDELQIGYDRDDCTLKTLTDRLHAFLLENHGRGRNTVLLIDEAQHLQFDVLEQIRLLTNLETNTRKLLQIILVGQPELTAVLAKPELRQLSQRITARYDLRPLNREETEAYIRHRLQVAGLPAGQELFPASVISGIHRKTRGIPRLINVLCDRILLGTYGQNKSRADRAMLEQAAREVLGEAPQAERRSAPWAIAVAVLLVLLLGAVYLRFVAGGPQPPPALPEIAGPAPGASSAPTQAVAVQEVPVEVPAEPEAASPPPTPMSISMPTATPWYGERGAALSALAGWLGVADRPASTDCATLAAQGLSCELQTADTWDDLLAFDRPAVLSLVTPTRFAGYAVLVGVTGDQAILLLDGRETSFPLAELGSLWRGEFQFLWRTPAAYDGPVSLGSRSPMVAWLAQQFALLDGQQEPLAVDEFNAALDARVRLFQRQSSLQDDGVVGLMTLLKFNEARGEGRSLTRSLPALAEAG